MHPSDTSNTVTVKIEPVRETAHQFLYLFDVTSIKMKEAGTIRFELHDPDANSPSNLKFVGLAAVPASADFGPAIVSENGKHIAVSNACTTRKTYVLTIMVSDGSREYIARPETPNGVDNMPEVVNQPPKEDD